MQRFAISWKYCYLVLWLSLLVFSKTKAQTLGANCGAAVVATLPIQNAAYNVPNSSSGLVSSACPTTPAPNVVNDGWLRFTATSSGQQIVSYSPTTADDIALMVYEGSAGCSGTPPIQDNIIGCADLYKSTGCTETVTISVVSGITYYVRVVNKSTGGANGTLTIYQGPKTAGDILNDAIAVNVGDCNFTFNITSGFYNNEGRVGASDNLSCLAYSDATNIDGWAKITLTATQRVRIKYASTNKEATLALYSGGCNALTQQTCASYNATTKTTEFDFTAPANGTYYLRIINALDNQPMNGELCISPLVAQDACASAWTNTTTHLKLGDCNVKFDVLNSFTPDAHEAGVCVSNTESTSQKSGWAIFKHSGSSPINVRLEYFVPEPSSGTLSPNMIVYDGGSTAGNPVTNLPCTLPAASNLMPDLAFSADGACVKAGGTQSIGVDFEAAPNNAYFIKILIDGTSTVGIDMQGFLCIYDNSKRSEDFFHSSLNFEIDGTDCGKQMNINSVYDPDGDYITTDICGSETSQLDAWVNFDVNTLPVAGLTVSYDNDNQDATTATDVALAVYRGEALTSINLVNNCGLAASTDLGLNARSADITIDNVLDGTGTGVGDAWIRYVSTSNTTARVIFTYESGDVSMEVYSGACGTLTLEDASTMMLGYDGSGTKQAEISFTSGVDYYIRIIRHSGTTTIGNLAIVEPSALVEIACSNAIVEGKESVLLNSLTSGFNANRRYYIRVAQVEITSGAVTTNGTVCITTNSVPEGDLCSNAFGLLVGDCDISFDLSSGFTNNQGLTPQCGGTAYRDVWFSFTATSGQTTIDYSSFSKGGTNIAIEAYRGVCNALNPAGCVNAATPNLAAPAGERTELEKLDFVTIPGLTYYARIMNVDPVNNDIEGNLCIYNTPQRDDCDDSNIVTKVVGECNIQFDVPVSFTLSAPYDFRDFSGTTPALLAAGITDNGGSISQKITTACDIDLATVGGTPTRLINASATASGNCASAFTLNIGEATPVFSIDNSLDTQPIEPTCATVAATGDAWFSFVGGTSPDVRIAFTYTDGNASLELYEGTCGSLNYLACIAANSGDLDVLVDTDQQNLIYNGITNGTTYYVRVIRNSAAATSGYLAVLPLAKDAWIRVIGNGNDVAIVYENNTATANPALVLYTAIQNTGPVTCGTGSNGVTYDTNIEGSTSTPTPGANQLGCANNFGIGANTEALTFKSNAGQQYLLRVIDLTGTGMQGVLCISDGTQRYGGACEARTVEIGDCGVALDLIAGDTETDDCYNPTGTDPDYGATGSNTNCNDCQYGDVFAKFTVPPTSQVPAATYAQGLTIQYDNRDGYATTAGDVKLVVYKVTSLSGCPTLSETVFNAPTGSTHRVPGNPPSYTTTPAPSYCGNQVVEGIEEIRITGVTAGDTYVIRVIRGAGIKTIFGKLCVFYGTSVASTTCPPSNNYGDLNGEFRDFTIPAKNPGFGIGAAGNAIPNNSITGCVVAGGSTPKSRSTFPIRSQAWMEFTVPDDATYTAITVQYDNSISLPLRNMAIAIYGPYDDTSDGEEPTVTVPDKPAACTSIPELTSVSGDIACANTVFVGAESVTFSINKGSVYFVRVMNIHNIDNPGETSGRIRVFPFSPCTRGSELVIDGSFSGWPALEAGNDGKFGDNDSNTDNGDALGGFSNQNDNLFYIPTIANNDPYPTDLDMNKNTVGATRVNTGIARFATDYGYTRDRVTGQTNDLPAGNSAADAAGAAYVNFRTRYDKLYASTRRFFEGQYLVRQSPWLSFPVFFGFGSTYSGFGGRTGTGVPVRSYCATGNAGAGSQACVEVNLGNNIPQTTGMYNPSNGVGGLDKPEPYPNTSDANFMSVDGSYDPSSGLPPGKVWCQTIQRNPADIGYYVFEVWVQNLVSAGFNLDVPLIRMTICDMENPQNLNQDPGDVPPARDISGGRITSLPGITDPQVNTADPSLVQVRHIPTPHNFRREVAKNNINRQYGAAKSCEINAEMRASWLAQGVYNSTNVPDVESRDARLKVLGSSFLITEAPDNWKLVRCVYRAPKGVSEMNVCLENLSITQVGNDFAIDDISFRECLNPDQESFDRLLKGDPCELSDSPLETALAASLLTFSGKLIGNEVFLNWVTIAERNTIKFNIQRSTNGNIFETIGSTDAKGNLEGLADYKFIDRKLPLGANQIYYRLQMVLSDGTTKLGPIVAVDIIDIEAFEMKLIPNPTASGSETEVRFQVNEGKAAMSVTDLMGNRLMTSQMNTVDGENSFFVNTSNLKSGIYIVKVLHSNGQTVAKKLLVY